ncbi:PSME3-interacting protein [Drosophila guanche]|uniref:Blast:Protein FAM192A n=1 Tax=Drosophila guanche TaxID=7266 RepID=A0A3B0JRF1_DROGU|nr:PSME3-interacting protein [Drosophila guanche]XP_034120548.1 PSME3-interacting protein [Drosophila guanche]SPP75261.1 blast:Protein FAM192A [Drosophila guanche]
MSSGFVTEAEAAEARQKRQEEWERVRQPEDPLERPEEPYDGRSLYDRLKEQKNKKDMEYEEAHKLKNLIRGLDDDEVQFLEAVDEHKINAERQQLRDEARELEDFRNRVEKLQEESVDKKLQAELKTTAKSVGATAGRNTQKSLLGHGIKRKNGESPTTSKVAKTVKNDSTPEQKEKEQELQPVFQSGLKLIATLPGIGPYTESSDSEASTDSDELDRFTRTDLCGRKLPKKKQCTE